MNVHIKLSLISLLLVACGGAATPASEDVDVDVKDPSTIDPSTIYLTIDEVKGEQTSPSPSPTILRFPNLTFARWSYWLYGQQTSGCVGSVARLTITNNGQVSSSPAILTVQGPNFASQAQIPGLAVGATWTIDMPYRPGAANTYATIDQDNVVRETNEYDNFLPICTN
jgi:hypothetical protein